MKVHILYSFNKGPYGGGNQFLKALNKYFKALDINEENIKKSNVILINSHHEILKIIYAKFRHPNKIFVHRIDGPIFLVRSAKPHLDKIIYKLNDLLADGTIFQSEWSKNENHRLGLKRNLYEKVIMNAADNAVFYPKNKQSTDFKNLIAVSWSSNINKGFDLYQFLDNTLNFDRYNMTFVGNSPISFKNIKMVSPINSFQLAELLRRNDIYITGSKNDPCSNSLIEALTCGLPCIALNDGGHPEIIKDGGEVFNTFQECIEKIKKVRENYHKYKKKIDNPNIEEISKSYFSFMDSIYEKFKSNHYFPKNINYFKLIILFILLIRWNVKRQGILEYFRIFIRKSITKINLA